MDLFKSYLALFTTVLIGYLLTMRSFDESMVGHTSWRPDELSISNLTPLVSHVCKTENMEEIFSVVSQRSGDNKVYASEKAMGSIVSTVQPEGKITVCLTEDSYDICLYSHNFRL
jgi:hypothetical protein